jgi:hypothetical protein
MSEQERRKQAQEIYLAALQVIAHDFGMVIEPVLQTEAVSDAYTTSRAVLVLKPVASWQPPNEANDNEKH